jgi:PAS domain S-box-containing protein
VEDRTTRRELVALQSVGAVPLASPRSLWWRVPAVAATYFVAARLGFMLDLEPGFASSIWPAAGVGSASLLIWGPRLWPGVLLGSFLFNWWLSTLLVAHGHEAGETADVIVALVIAGGVALQALLCASLARPVLRSGRVLTSVRSAVPLLLMSGPVSCLVSASVGSAARWLSGDMPPSEVWPNWFTWWMGDSIGVLFFVPLTLLAFPEARPRRLGLAARLAIPLIVVGVLVAVAHRATQDSRREHTSREMAAIENELQFQLNAQITNLHLVERLLTLAPTIDRQQFATFASQTLTPGAQTLEWVPRVQASERAAFEAAASRDTGTPFRILQPTETGALMEAAPRVEYFPTLYVEPLLTAETELGLDHSTDPIRRAAMARARDTGQATVTPPVLLPGDRQTRAVIAMVPVYTVRRDGASPATSVAERQDTLRGYAMSVVPIDSLAQNLAREAATLRLAASLADVSDPDDPVPIFSQGTPARAGASLRVSLPVVFGGRAWRLDLAPVRPDLLPGETRDGRLMLAGAVLLTFLTGLFVLTEAGLSIAVAVEVQHRTAELSGEVILRRRLEAQARESEARFRTIFDNSTDLLQSVDALGGFVQVNPAWKRLLGYTDDDLKHLNLFDVVAPEDAAIVEGLLLRLIRGEQVGTFDVTMLCKDGRRVVLEGNVSAHVQEGAPLVTRGIFRDVTTRKIAEEQLATVRERLGLALRGSKLALWDLDVEAGRVFLSEDWGTILGTERRDVVVPIASLSAIVHPDDLPGITAAAFAAFKGERPEYLVEHRVRTASGRWKWIQSHGMVTERSAKGRALRMTGTNADIDARKQAEEAMVAAERRLREVTDGLPGAVYQFQWSGGSRVHFNFLSAGVLDLLGVGREAIIRAPRLVFGAVVKEDRRAFLESLRAAITSGALEWSHEFRVLRKDGRVVWSRSVASRLGTGAEAVWNGYWVDISSLVEAERTLREARDAAESANRAKSAFLAAMSHEIRTPMNAILGMVELLEISSTNREHRDMLSVINASSQSLLQILNDVLDLSKVEAGHLTLAPVPASLGELIRSVALTFADGARRKGLALEWHADTALAPRLLFDPARLRQVLLNLVGNGVKFTETGTVSIRARAVESRPEAQRIEIVVEDSGIGISREDRDRLFQPFVQAEAPSSRNRGGTGLGLAISRRLAELMNGSLSLASEPGRGTTVTLSLELDVVTGAAADEHPDGALELPALRAGTPRSKEHRRILVVDDNEFNRAVLARQVAALGYEAEQASDGEEALQLVDQGDYALILADCQMPGMDGFEFAREVRRAEAESGRERIPIVAWTANVMPDDVAACRDAGMDDVLAKPSALPTVQRVLRTWVDRVGDAARTVPAGAVASPPPSSDGAPIDRLQLRAIMDGDAALEAEMLAGFRTASVKEAAALRDAFSRRDCTAIRHASHRMKGLARLVAASSLASVCERLERQARAGCVDDPAVVLAEFEREWHRVSDFLNAGTPG